MKKKILLMLLCLAAALGVEAQEITVASYNIRNDNRNDTKAGNGWAQRCPWLCKLVDFAGFDIFGAQEVKHNQLTDMLAALPDYDYIGCGRDDGKQAGEYSPIFYKISRFKLLDEGHFWLSATPGKPGLGWDAACPRICTWGRFLDRTTRQKFWFFNLHLDHVGVVARHRGAELVLRTIDSLCSAKEPVILTGDFNVDQHNEIYSLIIASEQLVDSFESAEVRYAPNGTFNAFDPSLYTTSRIDHIFLSPNCKAEAYGILTETYRTPVGNGKKLQPGDFPKEVSQTAAVARTPSDHYPVVVRVSLRK